MITNSSSRDRTRQFFSERREAARGAGLVLGSEPGGKPPSDAENTSGAGPSGAQVPPAAVEGLASRDIRLVAGRGMP
jgi:hypothetical protein